MTFLHWSYFLYFSILLWKISNTYESGKTIIYPVCKSPRSVIIHLWNPSSILSTCPLLPRLFHTNPGRPVVSPIIYVRMSLCAVQSSFPHSHNHSTVSLTYIFPTGWRNFCPPPAVLRKVPRVKACMAGKAEAETKKPEFDYCLYWGDPFARFGLFWARFCLAWRRWVWLLCKYGCVNAQ